MLRNFGFAPQFFRLRDIAQNCSHSLALWFALVCAYFASVTTVLSKLMGDNMIVDMTLDIDAVAKIVSVLATVGFGVWKIISEGKARLVTFFGHRSETIVRDAPGADGAQPPPFDVYTHSVVVSNLGRKTAFNVRLGHQHMPNSVTVLPRSIQYRIEKNQEGFSELIIPSLVAKEAVTVSYLYLPPITWQRINTYVKHDEGSARVVDVLHFEPPSKNKMLAVVSLMTIGALTLVYCLVRAAYALYLYAF